MRVVKFPSLKDVRPQTEKASKSASAHINKRDPTTFQRKTSPPTQEQDIWASLFLIMVRYKNAFIRTMKEKFFQTRLPYISQGSVGV